jgi:hypothetical protein
MFYVADKAWIDLDPYLDINTFDLFKDKIELGIAKNHQRIVPAVTPKSTFLDSSINSLYDERLQYADIVEPQNLNFYSKFKGATIGSFLYLRNCNNYPKDYHLKHLQANTSNSLFSSDFQFLFDWIREQECFSEYGRTVFFINDAWQQGTVHRDYPLNSTTKKKDMFIWISGSSLKKIFLYNENTQEKIFCPSRSAIFNNLNYHGSENNSWYSSWSLRVDGVFNKKWADKIGISAYYDL